MPGRLSAVAIGDGDGGWGGRLVMITPTGASERFLMLIIVPIALRKSIFELIHAPGSGAHIKVFKTLLLLRMLFYWPHIRKNVMEWVKGCSSCIAARNLSAANSGLVH